MRGKTPEENWIASEDVRNLLLLANYELVRQESKFLVPIYIPLISYLANRFLAPLPGFRLFNLLNIAVARPLGLSPPDRTEAAVSFRGCACAQRSRKHRGRHPAHTRHGPG